MENNPLSYKTIQQSRQAFRQVSREGFNMYDEPGTYWFKPIFYFYRSTELSEEAFIGTEGLLHPSWLEANTEVYAKDNRGDKPRIEKHEDLNFASSAYNYLMRNDDEYRARLLKRFIELLSNISTKSPWYFKAVSGLDKAIDHSEEYKSGKFVGDERRQIAFTMMDDAVDDRIGTLLDLYRSICYSWKTKREVVPANLRKFDMGIFIFGDMIQNNTSDIRFDQIKNGKPRNYEPDDDLYFLASGVHLDIPTAMDGKDRELAHQNTLYLEFQNCEINLSSTKIGDSMDNAEGTSHAYTLTIDYDECYVNRVNTAIKAIIGDAIISDLYHLDNVGVIGDVQDDEKSSLGRNHSDNTHVDDRKLDSKTSINDRYRHNLSDQVSNTLSTVTSNTVLNAASYGEGYISRYAIQPATKFLLGNLHSGSLLTGTQMLLNGNVEGVVQEVQAFIGSRSSHRASGRLYEKVENAQQPLTVHKLFETPSTPNRTITLGKLHDRNVTRNL